MKNPKRMLASPDKAAVAVTRSRLTTADVSVADSTSFSSFVVLFPSQKCHSLTILALCVFCLVRTEIVSVEVWFTLASTARL